MVIRAVISNLPNTGGSPITKLQYRINGGTAVDFPGIIAGTYDTTAVPGDDVEIRAINAVDANPANWSDIKEVAAGSPELLLNPSFTSDTVWTRTDLVTPTAYSIAGGNMTITNRGATFNDGMFQDVTTVALASYDLSVTVVSASGGGVRIKMNETDVMTGLTTPGTYTAIFTNTSLLTRRFIVSSTAQLANVVVSEVSMKLRP
jgi:hypothetical protein